MNTDLMFKVKAANKRTMNCLESREVAEERYNRKQRVITFWLSVTLVAAIAGLIYTVKNP